MRKIFVISLCGILLTALFAISCKKNKDIGFSIDVPVLSTSVGDIYQTSVYIRGSISDEGGTEIIQRGVCYSTQPNPTVTSNKIISDAIANEFVIAINNLSPATTYYVRAFATNSDGTGYGESRQITTKHKGEPVVNTDTIINIAQTNAWAKGTIISDGGDKITISGFCYSTNANPKVGSVGCATTLDSISKNSFTYELKGLTANATYYVRSYATNNIGTGYGREIVFKTSAVPIAPIMGYTAILETTDTSAIVASKVLSDGGKPVTERGLCYGLNPNPTNVNNKLISGSDTGTFTCTIKQLSPGTDYYVRSYAVNIVGISYGEQVKFTTGKNVPVLKTKNVTSITYNSAVTGGTVSSNGGAVIKTCGICYATTENPTISNSTVSGILSGNTFDCTLIALYPGTKYYVRAYSTNDVGTGYGEEISFTTSAAPLVPTVTTSSVLSITDKSAIMGGEVTETGGADVSERGVCYATTQNPTTSNLTKVIGSGTGVFSATVDGLTDGTKYHVRAYAINSAGTAYGDEVSFTTSTSPTVITTPAVDITQVSASLGGNITSDGGSSVTERGICFSTSTGPTILNNVLISGNGSGNFSVNVTSLNAGTTYYVRAFARNAVGLSYGQEIMFSTNAITPPVVIIPSGGMLNVTETTVDLQGNVESDGGKTVIDKGFCYSTSPNPTTDNSIMSFSSGIGNFSGTVTNLTPNTKYYARAYANNGIFISYSHQVEFTTNPIIAIGHPHQGGIIAYIFQSGDNGYVSGEVHGLIAAPSDQASGVPWCSDPFFSGILTTSFLGNSNTMSIVSNLGSNAIAANICSNIVLDVYSDWYLPSLQELQKLYDNRTAVGGFSGNYWSSTCYNTANIEGINFDNGFHFSDDHMSIYKVRAVRMF